MRLVAAASLLAVAACSSNPAGEWTDRPAWELERQESSRAAARPAARPVAPIGIEHLSARLVSKYRCHPGGGEDYGDCGDYVLTFLLHNAGASAVARVEDVRVALGRDLSIDSGQVRCGEPPWALFPRATSAPIELDLAELKLKFACGGRTQSVALEPRASLPYKGAVTVRLAGLLEDGTPWTAQASVDLVDATG